ncbi:hypothetical protein COU76_05820 [Candidatus Peregrinibacteria bacterium CG10_big_fil_rev_8_21_14_0_10_49_10]|nr:MAG: hypothetical protein COU76_05820 [Candidatus Peregrinibacteria bacterium CG10_big_fil_rev_8_21_14_0_10_49_10]
MNIQHFEKGFSYSDTELLWIARRIGKLATYCKRLKDESSSIRVDAECRNTKKQMDAIKMTVTVELPEKVLRAESRKATAKEALDRCVEKLEPQLKRYKELNTSRGRVQKAKASRAR